MTEGCNDEPNEKMNRGEPHYNNPNVVRKCVCMHESHYETNSHTQTHDCNCYYFVIFIIFLRVS